MKTYNGKKYKERYFLVDDKESGEVITITVAPYSLQEALGEAPYKDDSQEELIDDTISFYLEDELFNLSATEIVRKHLYGAFILIEEIQRLVTVYYDDIFISTLDDETPYEVYKDCPYVNLPIGEAEEIAHAKINNHEWESFLIPELTTRKIIYHEE